MAGGTGSGLAGQPRFLQLSDVADVLNISAAQAYALVRRGDLKAVKIGGRGQWRIEATELETFIQRSYVQTQEYISAHPFGADDEDLTTGVLDSPAPDR